MIFREYRAFLDTQMQTNLALSASMSSFEVFGSVNSQLPSGIICKDNKGTVSKVILDEADLYLWISLVITTIHVTFELLIL